MKKFKKENKVVRAQAGISFGKTPMKFPEGQKDEMFEMPDLTANSPYAKALIGEIFEIPKHTVNSPFRTLLRLMGGDPDLPQKTNLENLDKLQLKSSGDRSIDLSKQNALGKINSTATTPSVPSVNRTLALKPNKVTSGVPTAAQPKKYSPRVTNAMDQYRAKDLEMPPALTANAPAPNYRPDGSVNVPMAPSVDLSKLAGEIPKTKSGMKKFMDEYGKFIALGAMAGAGGKGGQIAAPIIAALPGLIEMMKKKKKPQFDEKPTTAPVVPTKAAHGGSMKKGTKKFAEGGKTNSGDRESAFRRLKPTYSGLSFLGTTTPLREDSISKKLMREEDLSYYPFADSEQQRNDKDMKHALASIIDEMYNEKNKLPAMQSEYLPMVIKQSKKDRGTYGFPYDSKIFKELQKGHIQSGKKSSGGEPPKKSEGGAIRKFKGGSMNTIKYKEGGNKSNKRFPATTLIPSEIFDQVVSKNPDAAKRMLGRLVYEQNFPSPRKSVKTSPRKYSPSSLEDNSYLSDIEAMGMMRNLEEAPDLPTGSSSTGKFITGIGDLPEAGPSSEVMNMPTRGGNRSIEDAIYSLAKDANIPASSVPKNKSGLKRFFSMIGKGLGIKKKSGSQDEGSQSLSSGGAIRKFKGGSMKGNTMDSTLTPKYAKGGDMPKGMSKGKMGKAAGEMPQHKKMAMGKPTPQSMGQKFAKGGAAKYASGGMCKGYGIAKKIRPTGPMN